MSAPRIHTTPVFSVSPSVYVAAMSRRRMSRLIWWIAAVVGVLAVLAAKDIRFAYLLLMFLFVLFPMISAFMWIVMTGKEAFTLCTRPQRWIISEIPAEALTVDFFSFEVDRDNPCAPVRTIVLADSDIRRIDYGKDSVKVWMNPGCAGSGNAELLIIPTRLLPPWLAGI